VHALVEAAARDSEPDFAVAMATAAFDLTQAGQDTHRRAGDIPVKVISDSAAQRGTPRRR
jgi:hypothetical protein